MKHTWDAELLIAILIQTDYCKYEIDFRDELWSVSLPNERYTALNIKKDLFINKKKLKQLLKSVTLIIFDVLLSSEQF